MMKNSFTSQTSTRPRRELKFLISPHQALILTSRLRHLASPDPHARPDGRYRVRTLYFDDQHDSAFHDKLNGTGERIKYRIRTYGEQPAQYILEKKIKRGQSVSKQRQPLTFAQYRELLDGHHASSSAPFKTLWLLKSLRPVIIVDYCREAFHYPLGDVRVTLDYRLTAAGLQLDLQHHDQPAIPVFADDLVILEVKYAHYLSAALFSVLQIDGLTAQAASKYTLCRMAWRSASTILA